MSQATRAASRRELAARGAERLAGRETARLDAELLLCEVLSLPRAALYSEPEATVAPEHEARFLKLLAERADGRPIAYLLGQREFWSLRLSVDENVLIPRPETELLVELALSGLGGLEGPAVADLGTGCGAIALALATERPDARVVATEASAAALRVAQHNRRRLGLGNCELREGDWLEPLAGTPFDLIVSNPPYVASGDPLLQDSELAFEPRLALDGGADGLAPLRRIVAGAGACLHGGGRLVLEHGATQGAVVRALLAGAGFVAVTTSRDLAGHERATEGVWPRPTL